MAREVTCITIDGSSQHDDCRCIEDIGYKIGSATLSKSKQKVHDDIKNGKAYFIRDSGSQTELQAVGSGRDRYVRTESNNTTDDNLLQQPRC